MKFNIKVKNKLNIFHTFILLYFILSSILLKCGENNLIIITIYNIQFYNSDQIYYIGEITVKVGTEMPPCLQKLIRIF